MHFNFFKSKLIQTLALISCFSSFSSITHAADTFTIDNEHTYVLWRIKHLGFSTQAGKWFANGKLILDKDHPKNSTVNVTINIENVITGIEELDKHLRGKDFFDVEKYPTATFTSTKVNMIGKDTANIDGTLTLHGVSKPVVLKAKLNKAGLNPITNQMTVGFSAHTTIKRSDFGIKTYLPALGDEVTLDIEVEANQPKK